MTSRTHRSDSRSHCKAHIPHTSQVVYSCTSCSDANTNTTISLIVLTLFYFLLTTEFVCKYEREEVINVLM
jgi:hypothetical protein